MEKLGTKVCLRPRHVDYVPVGGKMGSYEKEKVTKFRARPEASLVSPLGRSAHFPAQSTSCSWSIVRSVHLQFS